MNPFDAKPGLFDISLRMFGIALRIKPSYWLFLAIFGYALAGVNDLWKLLAWVIAGVVTTLVHELGQVIVGRLFGYPGAILLVGMGGGISAEYERAHRWQRILIYSGNIVGSLLFYALLYSLSSYLRPRFVFLKTWEEFGRTLYSYLLFKVIFDLALNWLPILPNAGGKIATDLMGYVVGKYDYYFGMALSILTTAGIVGYSLYKRAHPGPEVPYFGAIFRTLFPRHIESPLNGQELDPTFMAVIFGISGLMLIGQLIFRRKSADSVRNEEYGRSYGDGTPRRD